MWLCRQGPSGLSACGRRYAICATHDRDYTVSKTGRQVKSGSHFCYGRVLPSHAPAGPTHAEEGPGIAQSGQCSQGNRRNQAATSCHRRHEPRTGANSFPSFSYGTVATPSLCLKRPTSLLSFRTMPMSKSPLKHRTNGNPLPTSLRLISDDRYDTCVLHSARMCLAKPGARSSTLFPLH